MRCKILVLFPTVLLVFIGCVQRPLEDTKANREIQADRYLTASPPSEMLNAMGLQLAQKLPAEQREKFKEVLLRNVDVQAVQKIVKEALVKHYTTDELRAQADFYESAPGKSVQQKVGIFTAEIIPGLQQEVAKAFARSKGGSTNSSAGSLSHSKPE